MLKRSIISFLRSSRLLTSAEKARFLLNVVLNAADNRRFQAANPGLALPPLWLAYDAYSSCRHRWYWNSGIESAKAIVQYVPQCLTTDRLRLLEWGCGCGRILRQLRQRLPAERVGMFGSDYNRNTIAWCKTALTRIEFSDNDLTPPLVYESELFDLAYSVSVFTHLPSRLFRPWLEELLRVVKKGGLALITLNGDRFTSYLNRREREEYDRFGFACRGNVYEGSRLYNAYHRRDYVERACGSLGRIVMHDCSPTPYLSGGQDVYLIEKR